MDGDVLILVTPFLWQKVGLSVSLSGMLFGYMKILSRLWENANYDRTGTYNNQQNLQRWYYRARYKEGEGKADRKRDGMSTYIRLDRVRAGSSPSIRKAEYREEWRKVVARSPVMPQRSFRLQNEWVREWRSRVIGLSLWLFQYSRFLPHLDICSDRKHRKKYGGVICITTPGVCQ